MKLSVRPRRSALYLPASNPRAIAKAQGLPTDMVILDLEDAVAPERKAAARQAAIAAVAEGTWDFREVLVRVNATSTEGGSRDLAAAAGASGLAGVVIPKVTGPADVRAADAALASAHPGLALWAMIETCAAVCDLPALARTARDTRLAGLVMGFNDLAKEMRAEPGPDRAVFLPFLSMAVAAARAEGLVVLDGVCNALGDPARLEAECRQSRMFGVDGKTLIHPAQVDPCNAIFSPDPAAVARARRIVAAFEAPDAEGRGVVSLDGEMVELLHLEEARRLLATEAMIRR